MKKWSFVALLIVGATILGATVLLEPIAHAAQTTATTIVGPLDANGNVKVHEQGRATVKSSDQTQLVFSGTLLSPSAPLDVSAFKEIRVTFSCEAHGLNSSAGLEINIITAQSEIPLDQIHADCPSKATRTYELPGTSIRLYNFAIDGSEQPVDVAIFGRSN